MITDKVIDRYDQSIKKLENRITNLKHTVYLIFFAFIFTSVSNHNMKSRIKELEEKYNQVIITQKYVSNITKSGR